jgi:hypothetical protein
MFEIDRHGGHGVGATRLRVSMTVNLKREQELRQKQESWRDMKSCISESERQDLNLCLF